MAEVREILDLAKEYGFTKVVEMAVSSVQLNPEVRAMCATNKCKMYDTNWACPPGCGTLAECEAKVAKYKHGILIQTTGELEDSFDFEGMEEIKEKHDLNLKNFVEKLYSLEIDMMPLGDGCCQICKDCTYPDGECRFPKKAFSSMEAFGILVSDFCKSNQVEYYYGPNTLTYVGCVLFN